MRNLAPINSEGITRGESNVVNSPTWSSWFQKLYTFYKEVMQGIDTGGQYFGKAAPSSPKTGTIAYADGTNWDPGSGAGYYYYTVGGTWKYMA